MQVSLPTLFLYFKPNYTNCIARYNNESKQNKVYYCMILFCSPKQHTYTSCLVVFEKEAITETTGAYLQIKQDGKFVAMPILDKANLNVLIH